MQDFYFNVAFEVAAGKEEDFRRELSAIANNLQQSPGGAGASGVRYEVAHHVESHLLEVPGISAALQNRPEGRAECSFALVAHWQSLSHDEAAFAASDQNRKISFPSHPAFYQPATTLLGRS